MFTTDRVSVDTDKTDYPVTVFHICGNSGRLQFVLLHRLLWKAGTVCTHANYDKNIKIILSW